MAAPPPEPAPKPLSYAQATTGAMQSTTTISCDSFRPSTFKGEPSIIIPTDTEAILAADFNRALVGKFSQGRPSLDAFKKFLSIQNYKGSYALGLLDNKHALIRFQFDEDYIRLFSKPLWHIGNKKMRIFKWTVDFHVDKESSIVPVWISIPKLPIHLMNKAFIFSLMKTIGNPLRIDAATADLRRPSLARVQVEVDVLKNIPSRIWIQKENGTGFWQPIVPEGARPHYCKFCWHLGHNEDNCMIKNPNLRDAFKQLDLNPLNKSNTTEVAQVFVEKASDEQPKPLENNAGASKSTEAQVNADKGKEDLVSTLIISNAQRNEVEHVNVQDSNEFIEQINKNSESDTPIEPTGENNKDLETIKNTQDDSKATSSTPKTAQQELSSPLKTNTITKQVDSSMDKDKELLKNLKTSTRTIKKQKNYSSDIEQETFEIEKFHTTTGRRSRKKNNRYTEDFVF